MTFDPPDPRFASLNTSPPKCYECNDTGIMEVVFLKVLNTPARLYVTTKARDLCAYCHPES